VTGSLPVNPGAALLPSEPGAVVGIVGTAKNSGKTTALNWMLREATAQKRCAGLVSIGFDGETRDFWLGVEKPSVHVSTGTLVASAERSLSMGTAPYNILHRSGIQTPLGEVLIAQITEDGTTVLAGMRHRGDVRLVREKLLHHGADIVIVDGAYHRRALADPTLTDSVVLATGAVLAGTVTRVATDTAAIVAQLCLPTIDDPTHRDLLAKAVETNLPHVRGPADQITALDSSAIQLEDLADVPQLHEATAIAIPGVAADTLVQSLVQLEGPPTLLVPDATHLIVSPRIWRQCAQRPGWVRVGQSIAIRAVTVNPSGIHQNDLDPDALLKAVQSACPAIPVINVMANENRG
jgi:hypothetical protein